MVKGLVTVNTLIPHKIVNLTPPLVQIYTKQAQLIREFKPTGQVATAHDFQVCGSLPTIRLWNRAGHIPIDHQGQQQTGGDLAIGDEQNALLPLVYCVPVVTPKFLTPPHFGLIGTIHDLPQASRPENVWIPSPKVARLAGQANRADVVTWDESTLLFDEDGQIGIQRFVQW